MENAQPVPWVDFDSQPVGFEDFLLGPVATGKTQEINCLVQVTAGDDHAVAPISCSRAAATRICSRFVTASPVRAAASSTLGVIDCGQWQQPLDQKAQASSIDQIDAG